MNILRRLTQSRWVQTTTSLLVLAMIVRAGSRLVHDCQLGSGLRPGWFIAAVVLAVAYRVVNAYGWALVLRSLGQHIDGAMATTIWLRAETRRWLPGGMWGYASRAVQAKKIQLTLPVVSASMLIELLLTLSASLSIAVPVTICYYAEFASTLNRAQADFAQIAGVTAVLVLVCIILMGTKRRRFKSKVDSLVMRFECLRSFTVCWARLLRTFFFYLFMACLNGVITLLLMKSLSISTVPPAVVVIGATSISWLIGLFAIFAPGGMVVREGCFAVLLVYWLSIPEGLTVAVTARLVQMLVEVVCLLSVSMKWRQAAPVVGPEV